ncbi:MAG TPA: CopG family antitoxin [bacterium]|nr:CopG family antitoxin [bacterium]HOB71762.1 CopG family antitoxin [bacterium]HOG44283.1 CopG family antitoxin [bacterium]HPM46402.1 CopG family antitoxin [bacterium]HPV20518.1 CopG family antitoxin [bacterium]
MKSEFLKIIKDDAQYEKALERIDELIALENRGDATDEIKILSLLVSDYENSKYKLDFPDPVDAILFRMDQMGLKQKELVECIGSKSKVSEILSRKRPLTLSMIKNLNEFLGISLDILLKSKEKNHPLNRKRKSFSMPAFEVVREKKASYKGQGKKKTKSVTIRIQEDVIENIKERANDENIPYQTMINLIIKKFLESAK